MPLFGRLHWRLGCASAAAEARERHEQRHAHIGCSTRAQQAQRPAVVLIRPTKNPSSRTTYSLAPGSGRPAGRHRPVRAPSPRAKGERLRTQQRRRRADRRASRRDTYWAVASPRAALLRPAPGPRQSSVVRALADLRDVQLDVARPRVPAPGPIAVAMRRTRPTSPLRFTLEFPRFGGQGRFRLLAVLLDDAGGWSSQTARARGIRGCGAGGGGCRRFRCS